MGFSILKTAFTGSNDFDLSFTLGFINRNDVRVYVEGEVDGLGEQVFRQFDYIDDNTIRVIGTLQTGDIVVRQRKVSVTDLPVDFLAPGAAIRQNLNTAFRYSVMVVHEVLDGIDTALSEAVADALAAANAVLADTRAALSDAIDAANVALGFSQTAQSAKVAAENAEDGAAASATAALASRNSAQSAASTAQSNASASTASANAAATSRDQAQTLRNQAEVFRDEAEEARDVALAAPSSIDQTDFSENNPAIGAQFFLSWNNGASGGAGGTVEDGITRLRMLRTGRFCHVTAEVLFNGLAISTPADSVISIDFNLEDIGTDTGLFTNVINSTRGVAMMDLFGSGFDLPLQPARCLINASGDASADVVDHRFTTDTQVLVTGARLYLDVTLEVS